MSALFPFSAIGKTNYQPRQIEPGPNPPVIARSILPFDGHRFAPDVVKFAHDLANVEQCRNVFRTIRWASNPSEFWDHYDMTVLGTGFLQAVVRCIADMNLRWFCISWSNSNRDRLPALCGEPGRPSPCPENTFTEDERRYWGNDFLWDAMAYMRSCLEKVSLKQQGEESKEKGKNAAQITEIASNVQNEKHEEVRLPRTVAHIQQSTKDMPELRVESRHHLAPNIAEKTSTSARATPVSQDASVIKQRDMPLLTQSQPQITAFWPSVVPTSQNNNIPAPSNSFAKVRRFQERPPMNAFPHGRSMVPVNQRGFVEYLPPEFMAAIPHAAVILPPVLPSREHPGQPLMAAYPVVGQFPTSAVSGPVHHSRVFSSPRPGEHYQTMMPTITSLEILQQQQLAMYAAASTMVRRSSVGIAGIHPREIEHRPGRGTNIGRGRGRRFSTDHDERFQRRQSFSSQTCDPHSAMSHSSGTRPEKQPTEPFPDFSASSPITWPTRSFIPPDREDITEVWMGGFGDDISDIEIRAFFENRHPSLAVSSVSLLSKSFKGLNWCFVRFFGVTETRLALGLNGECLNGRRITVYVPEKHLNPEERRYRGNSFGFDRYPSDPRRIPATSVGSRRSSRSTSIPHTIAVRPAHDELPQIMTKNKNSGSPTTYTAQDARSQFNKRQHAYTGSVKDIVEEPELAAAATVGSGHHRSSSKGFKNHFKPEAVSRIQAPGQLKEKHSELEAALPDASRRPARRNIRDDSNPRSCGVPSSEKQLSPKKFSGEKSNNVPENAIVEPQFRDDIETSIITGKTPPDELVKLMPDPIFHPPQSLRTELVTNTLALESDMHRVKDRENTQQGVLSKNETEIATETAVMTTLPKENQLEETPLNTTFENIQLQSVGTPLTAQEEDIKSETSSTTPKILSASPIKVAIPRFPKSNSQKTLSSFGTESPPSKGASKIIDEKTLEIATTIDLTEISSQSADEEKSGATEIDDERKATDNLVSQQVSAVASSKPTGPKQVESLHPFARQKFQKKSKPAKPKKGESKKTRKLSLTDDLSSSVAVTTILKGRGEEEHSSGADAPFFTPLEVLPMTLPSQNSTAALETPKTVHQRSVSGKTDQTMDSSPGDMFHDARETLEISTAEADATPTKPSLLENLTIDVASKAEEAELVEESGIVGQTGEPCQDRLMFGALSAPKYPLKEISTNKLSLESLNAVQKLAKNVEKTTKDSSMQSRVTKTSLSIDFPKLADTGDNQAAQALLKSAGEEDASVPKKKAKKKKSKSKKKTSLAEEDEQSTGVTLTKVPEEVLDLQKLKPNDLIITQDPGADGSSDIQIMTLANATSRPAELLNLIKNPQSRREAIEKWAERAQLDEAQVDDIGFGDQPRWVSDVLAHKKLEDEYKMRRQQLYNVQSLIGKAQQRADEISSANTSDHAADTSIFNDVTELHGIATAVLQPMSIGEDEKSTIRIKTPESVMSCTEKNDCSPIGGDAQLFESPEQLSESSTLFISETLEIPRPLPSIPSDSGDTDCMGPYPVERRLSYAETLKAPPK